MIPTSASSGSSVAKTSRTPRRDKCRRMALGRGQIPPGGRTCLPRRVLVPGGPASKGNNVSRYIGSTRWNLTGIGIPSATGSFREVSDPIDVSAASPPCCPPVLDEAASFQHRMERLPRFRWCADGHGVELRLRMHGESMRFGHVPELGRSPGWVYFLRVSAPNEFRDEARRDAHDQERHAHQ